jgi:hypothetical protein
MRRFSTASTKAVAPIMHMLSGQGYVQLRYKSKCRMPLTACRGG